MAQESMEGRAEAGKGGKERVRDEGDRAGLVGRPPFSYKPITYWLSSQLTAQAPLQQPAYCLHPSVCLFSILTSEDRVPEFPPGLLPVLRDFLFPGPPTHYLSYQKLHTTTWPTTPNTREPTDLPLDLLGPEPSLCPFPTHLAITSQHHHAEQYVCP